MIKIANQVLLILPPGTLEVVPSRQLSNMYYAANMVAETDAAGQHFVTKSRRSGNRAWEVTTMADLLQHVRVNTEAPPKPPTLQALQTLSEICEALREAAPEMAIKMRAALVTVHQKLDEPL